MREQQHLSEREFAETLTGCASPCAEAHLAACTVCREETERAVNAIKNLRLASACWTEARQAAWEQEEVGGASQARTHKWTGAGWRPGLSQRLLSGRSYPVRVAFAGMLMAALIPSAFYASKEIGRRQAVHQSAVAAAQQAQIAEDNSLLADVNRELTEQVAPAMQPLLLDQQSTRSALSTEARRERD